MDTATISPAEDAQAARRAFPALCGLFPLACLGFGTVHPWSRAALALLCLGLGWQLWRAGRYASSWEIRGLKILSVGALAVSALAFIPVNAGLRHALQPGIAGPVERMLALAGGGAHPLALDPWRGLIEWAVGVGLIAVGWGTVAWVGRAPRARMLAWTLVGTGVVVVLLAVAQWEMDATSIYGSSGIPGVVREPFFGPFVNANHGGALCAALLPVGIAMAATGRLRSQVFGLMAVLILGTGVMLAGSRGALVAVAVGTAVTLLGAGSRLVRAVVLVAILGVVAWTLGVGPAEVVRALGDLVDPELGQMVEAGYVDLSTGRQALLQDVSALAAGVWPLGVGPGGFDDAYQIAKTTPAFNISIHAHNELLQVVVEHGAGVAIACLAAGVLVLRVAIQGTRRSGDRPDRQWLIAGFMGACAALCTDAMVDFPLRLGAHGLLLALAAGAALGLSRKKGRGRPASAAWRRSLGSLSWLALGALVLAAVGAVRPVPGFGRPAVLMKTGDVVGALQLQPTHRRAAQLWARDRVRAGDVVGAEEVLEVALSLYPTLPWLWRDRARLRQRTGDVEGARAAWREMLAQDLPGRRDPTVYVREAMLGSGETDLMKVALAVLPERADRRRQGARVFQRLGMESEAEALYKQALALNPVNVGPYASALLRWGRAPEVLKLLEGRRDGCGIRRLRALALLDTGANTKAVEAFRLALAKCGPRDWAVQAGLGRARLLSGDARGEELVERLLTERPEAHGLRRVLIAHFITRARPAEAAPHLQHLVQEGVARSGEIEALPRARIGLPVRLQDLRRKEVR